MGTIPRQMEERPVVPARGGKEAASYRWGAMIADKKKSKSRTVSEPDHSCQAAITLIGNYLAGSITLRAREDFEHHLGLCPDCAAFLKTYKKTIEVTRAFLRSQTPNPRRRWNAASGKARPFSRCTRFLVASFLFQHESNLRIKSKRSDPGSITVRHLSAGERNTRRRS